MKKITFAILFVAITIIYIIIGALIFFDIQVVGSPQTTIKVDLIEINSEEAIIQTYIDIYNPNQFEFIVDNLEVIATTEKGDEFAKLQIDGGIIPSKSNRSFTSSDTISFKGDVSGLFNSRISGTIGVKLLGLIKKTIPLEINIVTTFEDVIEDLSPPNVDIWVDFGDITIDDIEIIAKIKVYNPNSFDIYLENVALDVETETGVNVGTFLIEGSMIEAKTSAILDGYGKVFIEALNAEKLLIMLNAEVGAIIAGINKSITFSSMAEIVIPDLEEFIPPDKPFDLAIRGDLGLTLKGLEGDLAFEINNPTKIPLMASDIYFDYYRVDDDEKMFMARGSIEGGSIAPENLTVFYGDLFIPFSEFRSPLKGFLPDWYFTRLSANVSVPGVDLSMWVRVGAYLDVHPLRYLAR